MAEIGELPAGSGTAIEMSGEPSGSITMTPGLGPAAWLEALLNGPEAEPEAG
jgi:hypothetical protein